MATSPKLTPEQQLLLEQLRGEGVQAEPEVRFHPVRKWRIDVAVRPLAIEIDGGVFRGGRHTRGVGYVKDMEKLNALTELGWRILRFTPQQVRTGYALDQIKRCL